jgi:hypothetical protein
LLDFNSAVAPMQVHVDALCQALIDHWIDFRCLPPFCRLKQRKRGDELLSTLEVNVKDASSASDGMREKEGRNEMGEEELGVFL